MAKEKHKEASFHLAQETKYPSPISVF